MTETSSRQGKVTIEVLNFDLWEGVAFIDKRPITEVVREKQSDGLRFLGMEYIGRNVLLVAFEEEGFGDDES